MMEELIDFDKDEKVLDRYRYNNSECESIMPKSGSERLYQNVCMTQKKPAEKKKQFLILFIGE